MTIAPSTASVASPAPVQATIWEPAPAYSPTLVLLTEPTGQAAEGVRTLRTHIMAQHIHEGRRALAICAASRGVGCSFTAANLAIALSQIDVKTLLIDADLREPGLDALFGSAPAASGLAQCLASPETSFSETIQNDVLPNLSVIFAGGTPPNPQELLAGNRFKALVEFCLREFDATIIDTPAANMCADARRVSSVVGYSLIVARRHLTHVDDIKTLAAQLEADGARIVGTVLNET